MVTKKRIIPITIFLLMTLFVYLLIYGVAGQPSSAVDGSVKGKYALVVITSYLLLISIIFIFVRFIFLKNEVKILNDSGDFTLEGEVISISSIVLFEYHRAKIRNAHGFSLHTKNKIFRTPTFYGLDDQDLEDLIKSMQTHGIPVKDRLSKV